MEQAGRRDRLEISRGDVVVCASPGEYGKPRPAVVVQSDLFNDTHASIVICPITSHLVDATLFRPTIRPSRENGLVAESQIMVDKMTAVSCQRIAKRVGKISEVELTKVDRAMTLWLGLASPHS